MDQWFYISGVWNWKLWMHFFLVNRILAKLFHWKYWVFLEFWFLKARCNLLCHMQWKTWLLFQQLQDFLYRLLKFCWMKGYKTDTTFWPTQYVWDFWLAEHYVGCKGQISIQWMLSKPFEPFQIDQRTYFFPFQIKNFGCLRTLFFCAGQVQQQHHCINIRATWLGLFGVSTVGLFISLHSACAIGHRRSLQEKGTHVCNQHPASFERSTQVRIVLRVFFRWDIAQSKSMSLRCNGSQKKGFFSSRKCQISENLMDFKINYLYKNLVIQVCVIHESLWL